MSAPVKWIPPWISIPSKTSTFKKVISALTWKYVIEFYINSLRLKHTIYINWSKTLKWTNKQKLLQAYYCDCNKWWTILHWKHVLHLHSIHIYLHSIHVNTSTYRQHETEKELTQDITKLQLDINCSREIFNKKYFCL